MQDQKLVDRTIGPFVNRITDLNIPKVHREILANGTEYVEVNMGTQKLVQVEILYRGGRLAERKKGVSRATSRLLKEGTQSFSSSKLAETVDFYGANMTSGASLDYSYAKVFTLNKYFEKVIPMLSDILTNPTFSQNELDKYIANSIQKLKVERAKSELVAYRTITECLYGVDHPYGYNSTEQMYRDLNRDDLFEFFDSNFGSDNRIIIVSGSISSEIRERIKREFGMNFKESFVPKYEEPGDSVSRLTKRLKAEDNLQSAVKIGCRLFKRNHPNFADMFILNTILGGYFGSRLMSSLREDKGYTYNVYSSIDMMIHDGYFNVSTEVGNEYLEQTLEGIYLEMDKLKSTRVDQEELEMVRNYLSGNFLNMIDGPFKVAGMSKVITLNELDFEFYRNLMRRIHTISADDLYQIANTYFKKENMIEIIVGNP